jgi:general secretion pathway protein C
VDEALDLVAAISRLDGWSVPLTHVLAIVLVILIAKALAVVTWLPFQDWQAVSASTVGTISAGGRQSPQVAAVVTGHLFGRQDDPSAREQLLSNVSAPQTRLQLTLEGVFVSARETSSGAIVAERGKEALFYKVGDDLPGSAELVGVFADRVVLRRTGQLETLFFEDPDQPKESLQQVKQPGISSPEEFVSVAQRQLAENPASALASVGLQPAIENGQPSGYVYDGNNPMLRALNLQQGDVIRSVNGHVLGDVQRDREILQDLYQQGMLEVEVDRGGARFFVSYPLRQN